MYKESRFVKNMATSILSPLLMMLLGIGFIFLSYFNGVFRYPPSKKYY